MSELERRRPFFLRPFFLITVVILFLLAGAGGWSLDFVCKYEKKAAEFDLAKLDSVESASVIYDRYG